MQLLLYGYFSFYTLSDAFEICRYLFVFAPCFNSISWWLILRHFYVSVKHFASPGLWMVRYELVWPRQLPLVGKQCNDTVSEYFRLSGLYFLLLIGHTVMECYQVQIWITCALCENIHFFVITVSLLTITTSIWQLYLLVTLPVACSIRAKVLHL